MGMFKAPLLCERNNGGLKFVQEYHGADEEQKKQWYELNSSLIEKGKSAAVTSKQRWMNFFGNFYQGLMMRCRYAQRLRNMRSKFVVNLGRDDASRSQITPAWQEVENGERKILRVCLDWRE